MRVWRGWGDKSRAQTAVTHSLGSVCDGSMAQPLTQPVKLSFAPHSISLTNTISFFTLACILGITEQTSYTSELCEIQAGMCSSAPPAAKAKACALR